VKLPSPAIVEIGPSPLTIEQAVDLASGRSRAVLSADDAWRRKVKAGRDHLVARAGRAEIVYGVTTGVGDSCENVVPDELAAELQLNLVRLHGCGTGRLLTEEETAAVLVARLASLCTGWSAVREALLQRLCDLLNHRLLPCIPSEGSVGASGDLTPLSYVAAVLVGEREVTYQGRVRSAAEALGAAGLSAVTLEPKEALAVINGTSVMTGLACLAFTRAARLARLAASLTAMASDVTLGNPAHFDDRLFAAKPHPGQRAAARWIREDLASEGRVADSSPVRRIQDRYSIRCAPHVIGVLLDALPFFRRLIEVELNGANDNPLVDPESGDVLHGGNFYGGHIAFAMDGLKTAVANLADLMDRQLALICNPATSNGLPANLVGRTGPDRVAHHGFKAMEIATAALTAEALKLTMPASVFSRSTESHNQDKVSMGTVAARDCQRVLELTETVGAISLLALCQATDLRGGASRHLRTRLLHEAVRKGVPINLADRRMDGDIQWVLERYRSGSLPSGESDFT
jgi:histidine ammonia-lyase